MKQKPGSGGKKRRTIILVRIGVLLIVVFATSAFVLFPKFINTTQNKDSDTSNTSSSDAEILAHDTRSTPVKTASLDASKQFEAGDNDGAIKTLENAIPDATAVAEKVSLYRQLAKLYASENKKDEAYQAITSAINLTPNDWTLYKSQGLLQESFGDIAAAKASYSKALSMLDDTDQNAPFRNGLQNRIDNAGSDS